MTKGARVSICVPTYEQTVYLERTLTSIAEQEYAPFEVIVTDDSATDAVEELVRSMEGRLGAPLTYRRNKPAMGPPRNWNSAMDLTSGDLGKIMHHDEWFSGPASLGTFVSAMERSGADFAFCATDVLAVAQDKHWTLRPSDAEVERILNDPALLLLGNIVGAPSSTIQRRGIDLRYATDLQYLVDVDYYMRVIAAGLKVHRIDEVLIRSVSDAGHNVTLDSKSAQVELREHLVLFDRWKDNIPKEDMRLFERQLFGLFVKYHIRSGAALQAIHPQWKGGGLFTRLIFKARLFHLRQQLLGRTTGTA